MADRSAQRRRVPLVMVLCLLVGCVGLVAWWLNRPSPATEPVASATTIPSASSAASTATDLGDQAVGRVESRHEAAEVIEPAPDDLSRDPQAEPRKLSGIEILVRDLRRDLEKLHELKLYGTGERIVSRAVFLREDMLDNSLSMDEPLPKGWLDRHESYTAFVGPNGGRVYSFSRQDYPLFYEMTERKDQEFAAVLDGDLIVRITLFAEDAITLSGIPPK